VRILGFLSVFCGQVKVCFFSTTKRIDTKGGAKECTEKIIITGDNRWYIHQLLYKDDLMAFALGLLSLLPPRN